MGPSAGQCVSGFFGALVCVRISGDPIGTGNDHVANRLWGFSARRFAAFGADWVRKIARRGHFESFPECVGSSPEFTAAIGRAFGEMEIKFRNMADFDSNVDTQFLPYAVSPVVYDDRPVTQRGCASSRFEGGHHCARQVFRAREEFRRMRPV